MSATLFIGTTAKELENILLTKFKKETRTEEFTEDLFDSSGNKVSTRESTKEVEYYSLNGFENDYLSVEHFTIGEYFGDEAPDLEYFNSNSHLLKEDYFGLTLAEVDEQGNQFETITQETIKEVIEEMNSILSKFDIKTELKIYLALNNNT